LWRQGRRGLCRVGRRLGWLRGSSGGRRVKGEGSIFRFTYLRQVGRRRGWLCESKLKELLIDEKGANCGVEEMGAGVEVVEG
jgi:hypothetical protein